MKKGDKIGIVACSNGLKENSRQEMEDLKNTLEELGLIPVFSRYLYAGNGVESAGRRKRAEELMNFYRDEEIKGIFDVSGGDLANGVLPWLDYEEIKESGKAFWGYSDLTTVVNAITTKTGSPSVLYQIRNLIYRDGEEQKRRFRSFLDVEKNDSLFQFPYEFLQGNAMSGILIGGNVRCFLKLAGTGYFPELTGKILLLEACGGGDAQLLTYFSQLEQLGAFQKVSGILLGTFTQLEREKGAEQVWRLLKDFVPEPLPVAKTAFIGHGTDSGAAVIGEKYCFCSQESNKSDRTSHI